MNRNVLRSPLIAFVVTACVLIGFMVSGASKTVYSEELAGEPTKVPRTKAPLIIKAVDKPKTISIYFASDSTALSESSRETLQQYARYYHYLQKNGDSFQFNLEGNTGQQGSREYNMHFGTRLADAAGDYLLGLGVHRSDVASIGFGEDRPVCNTSMSEACQAQNRRVDIIIADRAD